MFVDILGGVMISVVPSNMADCGFDGLLGQTKTMNLYLLYQMQH
jgi:hypothetical protein